MAAGAYQPGNLVRCSGSFNLGGSLVNGVVTGGTATDPTGVSFVSCFLPTRAYSTLVYLTDAAVVKDATGVYHVDLNPSTPDMWSYRWIGTGALTAAGEKRFTVLQTDFGTAV